MPTQARRWRPLPAPSPPPLRLCDFHHREHKRNAKRVAERVRQRWFESVSLDDPKSIQKALAQIVQRLLHDEIDHQRAGPLLHKLQMATLARQAKAGGKKSTAEAN
jgi:hypothetical protein